MMISRLFTVSIHRLNFFSMCLYPICIKTVDAFGLPCSNSVPCGKCLECLKDRQNSWKIRLSEEFRDHLYTYFFTLTYNDSSITKFPLPKNLLEPSDAQILNHDGFVHSVNKPDVQKWIKRNRIFYERYFKREIDFKYFICAEYGPNTGRPHYHGILFTDISPTFISHMFSDWSTRFGFTDFSEVGKSNKKGASAVGNYVAKYCVKPSKLFTPVDHAIKYLISENVIQPTFYIMSKGLGSRYLQRMRRYHLPFVKSPSERVSIICDRAFYHEGAFKFKLPRFYRDRLYRKRFPCETQVWNKKLKCYETKIVQRYKSKNMLALQMQAEVRNRILAEHNRVFAEYRAKYPSITVPEVIKKICFDEAAAVRLRQNDIYSKMSKFYNYNRFKNLKF